MSVSHTPSSEPISASWQQIFAAIDKAGGPKLPHLKSLAFGERMRVMFSFWAFLFGPLYYLFKGMWKKAISLLVLGVAIILGIALVAEAIGLNSANIGNFVIPAICAVRAKVDYYKKMVLGDNGWW